MSNLIDLTGQRFSRLFVIRRLPKGTDKKRTVWECQCDCGTIKLIKGVALRRGEVKSCGCLLDDSGKLYNFKDITGMIFGKLVSIKRVYKKKATRWLCKCVCGKEAFVSYRALVSGNTKSCGCMHKGGARLPAGEAGLNNLFSQYKHHAKRKNREFTLTKEEFKKITQSNCFYCGGIPQQFYANWKSTMTKEGIENSKYTYNGIDRVDNSIGYIKSNVVPCCKTCNAAKGTLSIQEFMKWINKIYKTSIKTIRGVKKEI